MYTIGGVDERVDAAVGKRQYHGEVIEPRDDQALIIFESNL